MKRTGVIYSPKYLNHKTGWNHPDSPKRLEVIFREMKCSGILDKEECSVIKPEPARTSDLTLVHKPEHIELVRQCCASGGGLLDIGDTIVCSESFEVALLAAGGAVKAVDLVMAGKLRNAFALIRPPGHHAGSYYAMGFCVLNNVAVAASHLLQHAEVNRVLILDIDAHHGNGTQEIFYNTNEVLYISLHQDPTIFPQAGFPEEVGEEKGLGYTVNIPLPFHTDDQTYLQAFSQIVPPIVQQYRPQFTLISIGFDTHYADPVGELSLSMYGILEVFTKILKLADKFSKAKLVAVLEGGYSLRFLGRMATAAVARMAGVRYQIQDKRPATRPRISKQAKEIIEDLRKKQSMFWDF